MTIFVVFRVGEPAKMQAAMERAYPANHLKIETGEWLVSAPGTAKDVSDKLGVTPANDSGPAMVFSMANYYGRATTEIWDWVKAKAEASIG